MTVVIQARMSSKRCPGKVLIPIMDKPLLEYLIESIEHCRFVKKIIVATSTESDDDPIEKYCLSRNISCVRGDLKNPVRRFEKVVREHNLRSFVRISADSPLLDYRLIDEALTLFGSGQFDLVTNVLKRTFPKGQSVEVISVPVFLKSIPRITDSADLEHATRFFYQHADDFSIRNFESGGDWSQIQLSVDTPEDLARISKIIKSLSKPHWQYGWRDFADLKT